MSNPIPVLGIPHYNRPDLTARCIASIDYPVDRLVIVDQGPKPENGDYLLANKMVICKVVRETKTYPSLHKDVRERVERLALVKPCIEDLIVINHPNAGVAGAWNEVIKLFPASYWMLVNNDIEFAPGDLEKMAIAAQSQGADMIYGNHGASWFSITAVDIAEAGLFDENIYPAYLEDCDMSRRFDLLKLRRCDVAAVNAKHGDEKLTGSCTIMSDPAAREKNGRTHGANFDYYRAKWGGINEKETFQHPFNDPNWPVWAWKFDPEFRAKNQW